MEIENVIAPEYTYVEGWEVNQDVLQEYQKHGFIIVRKLLSASEIRKLRCAIEKDQEMLENNYQRPDGEGRLAKSVQWTEETDDIVGLVPRCEKVVNTIEKFLGGEAYIYHLKCSLKDAHSGGAWIWHQDYGYWYEDGCLFPHMATMYLALDKTTKENGCLKILPGSHNAGRVDHLAQGGQVGVDPERLALLERTLPLFHAELEAGDALFFHANMLHRSDQNNSPYRRWGYIASYNRADNSPAYMGTHGSVKYQKLNKVPNEALQKVDASVHKKSYYTNAQKDTAATIVAQKRGVIAT